MSNIQKQHKISPAIAWLTIQKFIIFYCPLDGEHTKRSCGASFFCIGKGDARTRDSKVGKRGQGNFKLAANFGYSSRGSADPRESLRKRRILKLALTAHKVSCHSGSAFLLRPYRNKKTKKEANLKK